jgi:hypothetical protein
MPGSRCGFAVSKPQHFTGPLERIAIAMLERACLFLYVARPSILSLRDAPMKHQKRKQQRRHELPPVLLDDQVLTFLQWVKLNALSERTGKRILASGTGPTVTRLSERRVGITVRDNRAWQESRARA